MVNVIELTKERERQGFVRIEKYAEIAKGWAELREKTESLAGWQTSQERKQCVRYGQNPNRVYGTYAEHYQQSYMHLARVHVSLYTLSLQVLDELEAMGRPRTFYNMGEDIPYVYCRALQGTSPSTASNTTTISPQQAQQWSAEFAQQQEKKQTPPPTQAPETPQNQHPRDDFQGPMSTDEAGL